MYYVIKIWGFLTISPLPFVITFSNERNQKLPFSDPPPLLLITHGCSHIKKLNELIYYFKHSSPGTYKVCV